MTTAYDVVFLALARDCATTIPGVLRGLQALQDAGLKVRLMVGENGSRDTTRQILEDASNATSGLVQVLDTSFMSNGGSRLERMARGRQFLADWLKESGCSTGTVGVVDMDEPFMESLDPAVLSSRIARLSEAPDSFAISASSRPTYYDLLAFEDGTRSFIGLDTRIAALQSNPIKYYGLFRDVIYPEQQRLTSNDDIECTSAFNGLCLYRANAYALGSYLPNNGAPWICEHVTFNRSLAAATNRRMLVDGSFVLPMPPEHGRRTLPGFVWQRARKLPSKVLAKVGGQ